MKTKSSFKTGRVGYWKGKKKLPLSDATKQKIKAARLKNNPGAFKKGDKHPKWKGGISYTREYACYLVNKRRALKTKNGGSHTFGEWESLKAQYNWTCPCCGKREPDIILTEDHIVPLSTGGSDNIENIQPLCRSCNSKKYNKTISYENVK